MHFFRNRDTDGYDTFNALHGILPTLINVEASTKFLFYHYGDVIMGTVASQITSLTIVYSTVY